MFKIYLRATVSFYIFFMQQYTAIVRDVYSYESKGSPLNKIWLQVVTRDISVMPMPRVNSLSRPTTCDRINRDWCQWPNFIWYYVTKALKT